MASVFELSSADYDTVQKIVDQMGQAIAGHPPKLQGAALADCLAIWLAGHAVDGSAQATHKLRSDMLVAHMQMVRMLVPVNAAAIAARQRNARG